MGVFCHAIQIKGPIFDPTTTNHELRISQTRNSEAMVLCIAQFGPYYGSIYSFPQFR